MSTSATAPSGGPIELRLPATATNVTVARQAVSGIAEACGWDVDFTEDVRLALSEACTNVVQHAYRHASSPGDMLVSLLLEAGRVVVAVRDEGRGLATGAEQSGPGMGLGMPLMRTLSDELELRSSEAFTEVRMSFTPTLAPQAVNG